MGIHFPQNPTWGPALPVLGVSTSHPSHRLEVADSFGPSKLFEPQEGQQFVAYATSDSFRWYRNSAWPDDDNMLSLSEEEASAQADLFLRQHALDRTSPNVHRVKLATSQTFVQRNEEPMRAVSWDVRYGYVYFLPNGRQVPIHGPGAKAKVSVDGKGPKSCYRFWRNITEPSYRHALLEPREARDILARALLLPKHATWRIDEETFVYFAPPPTLPQSFLAPTLFCAGPLDFIDPHLQSRRSVRITQHISLMRSRPIDNPPARR